MIAELQDQNVDTVGHSRVRPTYQVITTTSKAASFTYGHKRVDQGTYMFVGDGSAFPGIPSDGRAWIYETLARLGEIETLPEDWDGEGSPPTDSLIVVAAEQLLTSLFGTLDDDIPVPYVVPIYGGVFQFEWTVGERHLEIEFASNRTLYFLKAEESSQGPIITSGEYPIVATGETRRHLSWLLRG